jgi:hypothetical protein
MLADEQGFFGRNGVLSRVARQQFLAAHVQPLMSALPPIADIGTQPSDVCFVPKADIPLILSTGTKLIGQCRDRYYFNCEVGMRERSNPD